MPNRLVREGLMESERVLSLPVEGRWLFVIVMLSADDVGLFEATAFKLARRADVNRDLADKLLQMLADADLIRLYEVAGKRYGFIPRFKQRIQIKRVRYPLPPESLLCDDEDALSKIKHLSTKTTVGQVLDSRGATAAQPSEPEPEEEKVSVASQPRRQHKAGNGALPSCPYSDLVALYHEVLPEFPAVRLLGRGRKASMGRMWQWVLTSKRSDGRPRATTRDEGLAWFRGYFSRTRENDFLMGKTQRPTEHANWRCDLDFLLTEKGLKHVIEKTGLKA